MKKNVLKMFTACAAVCLTAGLIVAAGGNAKADEPFSVEYNFEDGQVPTDLFDTGVTFEVVGDNNSNAGLQYSEEVTGTSCLKVTNRKSGKKWWEQNGFAYDLTKLTPGVTYTVSIDVYHENGELTHIHSEKKEEVTYTTLRPFKIGTRYEGSDAGDDKDHPKNYSQIGPVMGPNQGEWERISGTIKIPEVDDYATKGDYFLYIFMAYPEAIGAGSQKDNYTDKNYEDYYIDNFSIKPYVAPTEEPSATPEPTPTTAPTSAPAATDAPAAPAATPYVYVDTEEDTWMEKGYEADVKGITYVVTGEGTAEVKESDASKVNIPATVVIEEGTYKVTSIANNAFKGNTDLKQLTIGANVTKIGKNAFYGCKNLKKITIKSKVLKTISAKAFKKTNAKATVTVPKAKKAAYKKMLKKAGLSAKAKIK